jgi:hypothetical protein
MSIKICIGGPLDGVFVEINKTEFECQTKHMVCVGNRCNFASDIIEIVSNYRLFEHIYTSAKSPYNDVYEYFICTKAKQKKTVSNILKNCIGKDSMKILNSTMTKMSHR